MGAGNQQERLGNWVAGFVDGEGCFHVAVNQQPGMTLGWQVLPEFRVVQHQRDETILHHIRGVFGCGNVVVNNGDRKEFRVRGVKNLRHVINFFQQYPLRTIKQKSFATFAKIITMMEKREHLTKKGLTDIARLSSTMNNQVRPRILRDYTRNTKVKI